MTPQQIKLALKLYKGYKTGTFAYRQLAERLGINTAELTSRCWHILHDQRKAAETARKGGVA